MGGKTVVHVSGVYPLDLSMCVHQWKITDASRTLPPSIITKICVWTTFEFGTPLSKGQTTWVLTVSALERAHDTVHLFMYHTYTFSILYTELHCVTYIICCRREWLTPKHLRADISTLLGTSSQCTVSTRFSWWVAVTTSALILLLALLYDNYFHSAQSISSSIVSGKWVSVDSS